MIATKMAMIAPHTIMTICTTGFICTAYESSSVARF